LMNKHRILRKYTTLLVEMSGVLICRPLSRVAGRWHPIRRGGLV
jgi:hypothetical protein